MGPSMRYLQTGSGKQRSLGLGGLGVQCGEIDGDTRAVAHDGPAGHHYVTHGAPIGAPHELKDRLAPRVPGHRGGVVHHDVGLLAGLEAADPVVHADGGRALDGGQLDAV